MALSVNTRHFNYTSHDVSAEYENPPPVEGTIRVTLSESYARTLYDGLSANEALRIPELVKLRTALGATVPFQA